MKTKRVFLFVVLLALISVSSVFANSTVDKQTYTAASGDYHDASLSTLIAVIKQLQGEVQRLEEINAELQETNLALQSELDAYKMIYDGTATQQNITVNKNGCTNRAEFIEDVTVPDGTEFTFGEKFVKTWKLRNIGTCTWTTGYTVNSVGKFHMGGSQSAYLPKEVKPNESVDVSMYLSAPYYLGNWESEYLLADEKGNQFGIIGTTSKKEMSFWLRIKVADLSDCALISSSPVSVWRNSDFDEVLEIRNNSGEPWYYGDVDIRVVDGAEFLKNPEQAYIDIPKTVENKDTLTLLYDMLATDDGGTHNFAVQLIKDGGPFCTVRTSVNFE